MKDRPIIFSAPMVRAILDGRKTQTRRIVKPPNENAIGDNNAPCGKILWDLSRATADPGFPTDEAGALLPCQQPDRSLYRNHYLHVPFAHPQDGWDKNGEDARDRVYAPWSAGDRLWVRETWCDTESPDGVPVVAYKAGGSWVYGITEAAGEHLLCEHTGGQPRPDSWRSPIHMPRWASRLTLKIISVHVERVHEIGRDGRKAAHVMAEGIEPLQWEHLKEWFHPDDCPALAFSILWDSINGKGSWKSNPWVWVIEFVREFPEARCG